MQFEYTDMTNPMIEKVARALLAFDYKDQSGEGDWLDMEWESKSHVYLAQARAAIEAMREASTPMVLAGRRASNTSDLIDHSSDETYLNADKVFAAMIDAALKDEK